jgi:3-phosphoshikimate 1-carboxyvinyltransferase
MMKCEVQLTASSEILRAHRILVEPMAARHVSEVKLLGSKSYSNRALVLAALAQGKSEILGVSPSDDSKALLSALRTLGCELEDHGDSVSIIGLVGNHLPSSRVTIDVGPAGTTMRFLVALIAGLPEADVEIRGSARMHERPIADLVETLRKLGAKIDYLGKEGCPPLSIKGQKLKSVGSVEIPGTTSSQYISALLLSGSQIEGGLDLKIKGDLVSKSYMDMTLAGMRDFGLTVQNQDYSSLRTPAINAYSACRYDVEGDASAASYFWGLSALTGREIKVKNIALDSAQGDVAFSKLLERMGCELIQHRAPRICDSWISIRRNGPLKAIEVDMELMPDTAQSLAMVAAFAEGTSLLSGLQTLKVKETDRLLALKQELGKLNVETEIDDRSIRIKGQPNRSLPLAQIDTYEDHRMAMSFGFLAAACGPLQINEPAVVTKSFPSFWDYMSNLGVKITCE